MTLTCSSNLHVNLLRVIATRSELQDTLSCMASLPHDLVLMGDFNLHVESLSSDVRQLTGILESFNLDQYVNFPTHIRRNSLHLDFL